MSGKKSFEDDGHAVADMSDFARPTPFGFRSASKERRREERESAEKSDRPWEDSGMDRAERRRYVWGAISAALLVAAAFIVGLGAVILLLVLFFA